VKLDASGSWSDLSAPIQMQSEGKVESKPIVANSSSAKILLTPWLAFFIFLVLFAVLFAVFAMIR
jgi:hypothetical protein